ncbi:MAG: hypothetical protein HY049_05800 [Acidobacteria bacterium]|nr:hypothetical protein [Acidobacteriota bacterium]
MTTTPARARRRVPPARSVAFCVALAASAALASSAAAAEKLVDVRGRVTSPDGLGAAGQTVRLIKTRRQVTLGRFESGGQIAEAARVATDADGFYQISVPRDRSFDAYYLRFYDPNSFDTVQYRLPADREITHDLKHAGTLRIDLAMEWNPSWPETSRRVAAEGADTPRGRILRTLGVPEREEQGIGPEGPREEWWYHSRGVVYFFREGRPAGSRRFEPVTEDPRAPAAPQRAPESAAAGGGV